MKELRKIYIRQHQTHPLVLVTFSSHPNDNHLCTQNQLLKYKSDCMQGMKIVNNKHESLYEQNKNENIYLQEVQQHSSLSCCGRIVCENELPQILVFKGKIETNFFDIEP